MSRVPVPEGFEFNQYLSFMDICQHPRWLEYADPDLPREYWDTKVLEQILFDLGADIKRNGYEIIVITHRPRTVNRVVHCDYVMFTERTDKFWIDNYMQTEDIVRNHPSEIVRTGMTLAMNQTRQMQEAVRNKMEMSIVSVDIKVDMSPKSKTGGK